MKPACSLILLIGFALTPARAQVVWVLPGAPNGTKHPARVIFSAGLDPARSDLPSAGRVQVFLRGKGGEAVTARYTRDRGSLLIADAGRGLSEVVCLYQYGVAQREKAPPALANYYAKTYVGLDPGGMPPAGYLAEWDRMPLEVVPILDENGFRVQAVWQGKPLTGAEYTLLVPGRRKPVEGRANGNGLIVPEQPGAGGLYGVCVRHTERRAGEYEGKKYREVRHYSTLTFAVAGR